MSTSPTNISGSPVFPTVPTFPASQALWSKAMLSGGFKPGELAIWTAGRRTGKSMIMSKMMMNSMYGKFGGQSMFDEISVTEAYKGEWRVNTDYSNDAEIRQWFHDALGEPGRNRRYRWRANNTKPRVYFLRHESDLLMFRLRWM